MIVLAIKYRALTQNRNVSMDRLNKVLLMNRKLSALTQTGKVSMDRLDKVLLMNRRFMGFG
jgi:hypothetical protein